MTPGQEAQVSQLHLAPDDDGRVSQRDVLRVTRKVVRGVAVVTAVTDGVPRGVTVSSFTQVSFEPPLVMVAVKATGGFRSVLAAAPGFGVSVLCSSQQSVAEHFASPRRPDGPAQFAGVPHRRGAVTGSPLLDGAVGWLDCQLHDVVPVGDHVLVIGRVLAAVSTDGDSPLLHAAGRYRHFLDTRAA